ncbi:glycosyltransferase family 1 protein [Faecalicatena orotica]|uniref:glycosyltransferase n=1 Tax=Faecalicatena orotica TaxID=1544 RepID=UPI0031E39F37
MRILHIIPGFGGGISSFVKNIALGNNNCNITNDVIGFNTFPDEYKHLIANQGGKTYTLPSVHKSFIQMTKEYTQILRDGDYDVVHCHFSGYKSLPFKFIARKQNIKRIVTHAHRTSEEKLMLFSGIHSKIEGYFSRALSTDLLACSTMAGMYIFGKSTRKVIVIPNSVDTEKFMETVSDVTLRKYRQEFQIDDDCYVIGHIGRFNLQKNHRFIIRIAKTLKGRDFKFKILLIGDGELFNQISEEISRQKLEDCFVLMGKRKDVSQLLKLFDVMILPSLFEGLPTVAVEAQAAGVSCLLADTITLECDMHMGNVKYLPLKSELQWCDEIMRIGCNHVAQDMIRDQLEKMGFTLNAMQEKYLNVFSLERGTDEK